MKRSSRKILLTCLALVVFAAAVGLGVFFIVTAVPYATSSQVLTPTSYPVGQAPGSALVVYDPGSTATVKDVARQMASSLQSKGYFVFLAGIDSKTAKGSTSDTSQYKVVIVGGPLKNGESSSSVQSYLTNFSQGNGTLLGIFGVGNSNTSNNQIAPLPSGSSLIIKETGEISTTQGTSTQSAEFVTQMLR
jgi:hypothetical protein